MVAFFSIVFLLMLTAALLIKNIKVVSYIHISGLLIITALIFKLSVDIYRQDYIAFFDNLIYIDSLSLLNLLIITLVSLTAVIYSHRYIQNELKENAITTAMAKLYYALFALFTFSMLTVCVCNNIVGMWIGLEATTLSTAFLIGFNRTKLALEAAWKYIIICSIGIGLGLIGIILLIYAAGGDVNPMYLDWTFLVNRYHALNPRLLLLSFTFIFIGIGTKAGLAPMHTWLPDGHSEAPSPISAMMSGILLNLALYVVIRFYIIIKLVGTLSSLKYLFIAFGCLSLFVAAFSMLNQKNYKRLLAFSSIENVGIIALGLGFGGYLALFGALLHAMIHAFGKTLLFLISGNLLHAFKTKRIDKISGMIRSMPIHATLFITGMLVITGAPPFASFFSEFYILIDGIKQGYYLPAFVYALCLIVAFAAFFNTFIKMIFVVKEGSEDSKLEQNVKKLPQDRENLFPLYLSLFLIIGTSFYFGGYLTIIIDKAVHIIMG